MVVVTALLLVKLLFDLMWTADPSRSQGAFFPWHGGPLPLILSAAGALLSWVVCLRRWLRLRRELPPEALA